jgi:hypothetical protein
VTVPDVVMSAGLTVGNHIVPSSNENIDLGSASFRFRDLYLSGESIDLGGVQITKLGSSVALPAGSTIGGVDVAVKDVSGNINYADNEKAIFGTGSDLEIYHDGSNSFIADLGTGLLQLRTNGPRIELVGQSGSEYMARFEQDGPVKLFYDAVQKLATTSTGAQITDSLLLGTDDTSRGSLYLYGDGTGSAFGGFIRLYNPADHDTTNEYFTIKAQSNQFIVEKADGTDLFTYIDSDTSFRFPDGTVYVGSPDNTKGNLYIQGDGAGSVNGGEIRIYNAADHDSNVNYYSVYAESEDFLISYASTDFLQYDYDISQWKMPRSGGLSVTGNVVVNGQLEVSTIDTSDSSAITITPAAVFNSDVTVGNDIVVTNKVTAADVTVGNDIVVTNKVTTTDIAASGTVQDSQGNVRVLERTGITSTPYALPANSSGKYFSCGGGSGTITIDSGNCEVGQIITIFNFQNTGLTISWTNMTNGVFIAGDTTGKGTSGSVTLTGKGLVTILSDVADRLVMNGNVS